MEFTNTLEGNEPAPVRIKYYPVDQTAASQIMALFHQTEAETPPPTITHPHPGDDWEDEFRGDNEFAQLASYGPSFEPSSPDRVVLFGSPVDDLEPGAVEIELTALSRRSRLPLRVLLSQVEQEKVPLTLVERGMRWLKNLRK